MTTPEQRAAELLDARTELATVLVMLSALPGPLGEQVAQLAGVTGRALGLVEETVNEVERLGRQFRRLSTTVEHLRDHLQVGDGT